MDLNQFEQLTGRIIHRWTHIEQVMFLTASIGGKLHRLEFDKLKNKWLSELNRLLPERAAQIERLSQKVSDLRENRDHLVHNVCIVHDEQISVLSRHPNKGTRRKAVEEIRAQAERITGQRLPVSRQEMMDFFRQSGTPVLVKFPAADLFEIADRRLPKINEHLSLLMHAATRRSLGVPPSGLEKKLDQM
jgi:chromosome condensin MukBEF ATPase and DNA-binding subunit MukB